MKSVFGVVAAMALLAGTGCGDSDPNKNLKPVDKSAPRPSAAGEGAGGKGPASKAPSPP